MKKVVLFFLVLTLNSTQGFSQDPSIQITVPDDITAEECHYLLAVAGNKSKALIRTDFMAASALALYNKSCEGKIDQKEDELTRIDNLVHELNNRSLKYKYAPEKLIQK